MRKIENDTWRIQLTKQGDHSLSLVGGKNLPQLLEENLGHEVVSGPEELP